MYVREAYKRIAEKAGLDTKVWKLRISFGFSRLGLCNFKKKEIRTSKDFLKVATQTEIDQHLAHEIAHAVLPIEIRHKWQWRQKCIELGGTGKRLARVPAFKENLTSGFYITCPNNCFVSFFRKRPFKRLETTRCRKCKSNVKQEYKKEGDCNEA